MSPAFSTMILTAAVIVMLMVAMGYANDILNLRLAQNELSANKQFMQTTGAQLDDTAWSVGRTQTITYSSKFGSLKYQDAALSYKIDVDGQELATIETGVILYNIPVSAFKLSDSYFERVPFSANGSFMLSGASAPVNQVFCVQKASMSDGDYLRVVLVPTIRVLASTISDGINSTTYVKIYLPSLQGGEFLYRTNSLTLAGEGISKFSKQGVNEVKLMVGFPSASGGFDSTFYNFTRPNIDLNSTSTPKIDNSVVELYVGNVRVNIGQV